MRISTSELRLRLKNRKPRPFSRVASANDADISNGISGCGGSEDSAVSSPSTPNSSLSSQSNLITTPSPNTPSPATPTQQLGTPSSSVGSSNTSSGVSNSTSGHKNSLKGTKLARRARSFKDDLFEKISLMRTPNTLGRSHSPHSPRNKHATAKPPPTAEEVARSSQSLEAHVKDITNALKHFRDVILKKKLEVLPGNGTVILETIASLYAVIQSYTLNEKSSVLLSATQQVYQSLGKLIKLCDEVMLSDDSGECASLSNDNVREVVDLLENAVKNLVVLAQQKLKEREESAFKYGPINPELTVATASHNHLMRPPVEVAGQRTSLPDITLTPKERDILEKTKSNPIRASHSTESILRDTSPPPKPPLPNRLTNPPPLPPKRRMQQQQQQNQNSNSINSDLDCSSELSLMNYGVDHLSVRSGSPDVDSSQCSLDLALNNSREEDELKALESTLDDSILEDDMEKMFDFNLQASGRGDTAPPASERSERDTIALKSSNSVVGAGASGANPFAALVAAGIQNVAAATVLAAGTNGNSNSNSSTDKLEMRKTANNRHSNESGFVSMKSIRTSTQSGSKRSSGYSIESSTKSSNSDFAVGSIDNNNTTTTTSTFATVSSSEYHLQQEQTTTTTTKTTTTTTSSARTTSTSYESSAVTALTENIHSSSTSSSLGLNATAAIGDNASIRIIETATSPERLLMREKVPLSQFSMVTQPTNHSFDMSTTDGVTAIPPALPPKTLRCKDSQLLGNFDEFDDFNSFSEMPELRHHRSNQSHYQQQHYVYQLHAKHQSCNAISVTTGFDESSTDKPPPLPMKKKHILAYMEICSASTRSTEPNRHTMYTYKLSPHIPHSQTMNIVPQAKEFTPPEQVIPPALPPKNYKQRKPSAAPPTIITTPPPSPKPAHLNMDACSGELGVGGRHGRVLSGTHVSELMSTVCEELPDLSKEETQPNHHAHNNQPPTETDVEQSALTPLRLNSSTNHSGSGGDCGALYLSNNEDDEDMDVVLGNHLGNFDNKKTFAISNSLPKNNLPNMLEELDITPYLILKKVTEDGPEVRGGYIDALIVHASRVQKVSDNAFSEAFITTFRTFIQPMDVIEKLTHRYTIFFCQLNDQKQKAAKETFSLLVRVVNDLTSTDFSSQLLTLLVEFVYQLVCSGQLYQAKLLRNKIVEKVTLYKEQRMVSYQSEMHFTVAVQPSLLELKSVEIAEQMTLLDAELFQKIEIPEVLLFAKEQCEEKSPNLNKFTEHFNKMSYWARSKILTLSDAKEREKHVIKFIKIMKHLRKMNNYNSYLALLSALDSAPIRRLEWHKTITEGLTEYCTLIDSSSSFRVYRQALAETNPPCIPYIGLVLQDLTFVHVGNPDYLKEGVINFSKRWQQHNIIVNMKRFKKCAYPFRRNNRIIRFFENFENFLGEEEMWQISETIKPRGKRQAHN